MTEFLNRLYRKTYCLLFGHQRFTGWGNMEGRGYLVRACLCCGRVERRPTQ